MIEGETEWETKREGEREGRGRGEGRGRERGRESIMGYLGYSMYGVQLLRDRELVNN